MAGDPHNNGREYVNTELTQYLKARGIIHQTTVPYTPERNGAAERLNRTFMERARAMTNDARLSKELWAEAVNTANYIRRRSPSAKKLRTPRELFFGQKPDVPTCGPLEQPPTVTYLRTRGRSWTTAASVESWSATQKTLWATIYCWRTSKSSSAEVSS